MLKSYESSSKTRVRQGVEKTHKKKKKEKNERNILKKDAKKGRTRERKKVKKGSQKWIKKDEIQRSKKR